MKSNRLLYIDNLRIFLICLVILHHLAITYGAPGGWYYNEGQAGPITSIFLTLFVASNQSYFMGLLFLISAFFTANSFKRKGVSASLKSRLTRLGVPLVLFHFLVNPITVYYCSPGRDILLFDFILKGYGFGFGPLWFVEVLFIFAILYAIWVSVFPDKNKELTGFPKPLTVILFAFVIGLISFVIRFWIPVGWSLAPFNFQLAYFPQYVACLILGVMAYDNNWFDSIEFKKSVRWYWFALFMVLITFPLVFYFGGAATGNTEPFNGGFCWQSFAYSMWDQLTGFAFMIALLGIFKKWFNVQGQTAKTLSKHTYGMYIFHPLVLVLIGINLRIIEIPLGYKFLILAFPSLLSCFFVAFLFRKLPFVNKII